LGKNFRVRSFKKSSNRIILKLTASMLSRKTIALFFFLSASFINCIAQPIIKNDRKSKTITFGNKKIKLTIDYNDKADITTLEVNGQKVIDGAAGIYSEIRTPETSYSSLHTTSSPAITKTVNTVKVSGISYGDNDLTINEKWSFIINDNDIKLDVDRTFSKATLVEEASLPSFNFNDINTWEGASQSYGGLAWFYLFNERLCTYGVHSNSSRFWNSKTGNG
jgi:hypothetical protein